MGCFVPLCFVIKAKLKNSQASRVFEIISVLSSKCALHAFQTSAIKIIIFDIVLGFFGPQAPLNVKCYAINIKKSKLV